MQALGVSFAFKHAVQKILCFNYTMKVVKVGQTNEAGVYSTFTVISHMSSLRVRLCGIDYTISNSVAQLLLKSSLCLACEYIFVLLVSRAHSYKTYYDVFITVCTYHCIVRFISWHYTYTHRNSLDKIEGNDSIYSRIKLSK